MSESKMHRLRLNVEPECVAEDSKIRLYLSLVQREDEQRYKRAAQRKWKKILWKKKIRTLMDRAIRWAVRLLISLSAAVAAAAWVLPASYRARGYWAIGGECFLILAAFYVTYKIAGIYLRE